MFNWKHREAVSGRPIAGKLVAGMRRRLKGKVVSLDEVINRLAAEDEIQDPVAIKEVLAALHPAHAAYVRAQNQVSVMSEQFTGLKEMAPFVDIVAKAEDLYAPSAPPMSPLRDPTSLAGASSTRALERPERPSAAPFWKSATPSAWIQSYRASSG
jgi:hypothetical protein